MIVVTVLSFAFLDGSMAVFIGIAAAIIGALFIIKGIQAPDSAPAGQDPLALDNYGPVAGTDTGAGSGSGYDTGIDSGFDWDEHYRREFGGGTGDTGSTKR